MTESDNEPPADQPPHGAFFRCPHCGYTDIVHIRASDVVAIYKCPGCGELVAPAKNEKS